MRQPYLHDLAGLVSAPAQAWCSSTGDIAPGSVGVVFSDIQIISGLTLTLDDQPVTWLHWHVDGAGATFAGIARHLQDERASGADPRVTVRRTRRLHSAFLEEVVEISSALDTVVQTVVEVLVTPALDPIDQVKDGRHQPVRINGTDDVARWSNASVSAALTSDMSCQVYATTGDLRLHQPVTVPPGGAHRVTWRLEFAASTGTPVIAAAPVEPPRPDALSASWWPSPGPLRRWLDRSLADLASLRLEHRAAPGQAFFGAGAPWYLTLFGRDSLWAARLSRQCATETARSTLRVLAALQGTEFDPVSEEAPGKILHEIRGAEFVTLPTRYYGTIDATSLWVNLLADLCDDGQVEPAQLRDLQPALLAALSWITGPYADPDGDGFLEYTKPAGKGLANQGWKDSVDAVRFADGHIAQGPIALCEVQGYAYAAAVQGSALLEQLGVETGAAAWAEGLRTRFQEQFCPDGFPGFALDGDKKLVDATTSNIGHLLGTGILDPDQERAVADRLVEPDISSGLGLRTMSSGDAGYHPLSYHCGSVWAHDTAVVIDGLLRAGLGRHAALLARGLARAAERFDDQLPELWSGDSVGIPYPAACHPQAWAAAAAVPAIRALAAESAGSV